MYCNIFMVLNACGRTTIIAFRLFINVKCPWLKGPFEHLSDNSHSGFYFERLQRKRCGWWELALTPERRCPGGGMRERERETAGTDWLEEEVESVPVCIWPAPLSVTPGQTRPALLTHSPPVFLHGSARTHTALTHSLTHTDRQTDAHGRTRNGDGREPEQPVHHGLPSRPLVMKKKKKTFSNTLSYICSFTSETNLLFCARTLVRTPPHRELSWKSEMLHWKISLHACDHTFKTSVTTLSKPHTH